MKHLLFTFHYGPIQIEVDTEILAVMEEFTFHYGPIQISLPLAY